MTITEKILILSRTKINSTYDCIGGISLNSFKNLRLVNPGNKPILNTDPYDIGEIWDIKYSPSQYIIPPHIEDVIVEECELTNNRILFNELNNFLLEELGVPVWYGTINNVFDSKLNWTNGGMGYIEKENLPNQSVGFWIPTIPLYYITQKGIWYYYNDDDRMRYIKYVGYQEPIKKIQKNTVVRVSLTRWLNLSSNKTTSRCYLQISGWY